MLCKREGIIKRCNLDIMQIFIIGFAKNIMFYERRLHYQHSI